MKKGAMVSLGVALTLLISSSAFALTSNIMGGVRVKGLMINLQQREGAGDKPDKLVNTRFRMRWTGDINEYLSVVYYGEVDFEWGDASFQTARNQGGGLESDSVNLETKQINFTWKIPDTLVAATVGIQTVRDQTDTFLLFNDASGINVKTEMGKGGTLRAGWYKLFEGDPNTDKGLIGSANLEDDVTLYSLQWTAKPMGKFKTGADFFYFQNQKPDDGAIANPGRLDSQKGVGAPENTFLTPGQEDIYFISVSPSYKVTDLLTLSGWAMYNWGTMENLPSPDKKTKVSAFAGSARADLVGKGWRTGLHSFYFPSDDDNTDKKMSAIRHPVSQTVSSSGKLGDAPIAPFGEDNLSILLSEGTGALAAGTNPYSLKDGAMAGYGAWGIALSGTYNPPIVADSYVKVGLGYFSSLIKDRLKDASSPLEDRAGKEIGKEIALRIGFKSAKNLDISLNAAYAWLGDFYKHSTTNWKDKTGSAALSYAPDRKTPDNPYTLFWMADLMF